MTFLVIALPRPSFFSKLIKALPRFRKPKKPSFDSIDFTDYVIYASNIVRGFNLGQERGLNHLVKGISTNQSVLLHYQAEFASWSIFSPLLLGFVGPLVGFMFSKLGVRSPNSSFRNFVVVSFICTNLAFSLGYSLGHQSLSPTLGFCQLVTEILILQFGYTFGLALFNLSDDDDDDHSGDDSLE